MTGELPLCPELCSLDFSSDLLPERFMLGLTDQGRGGPDCFAVGRPLS